MAVARFCPAMPAEDFLMRSVIKNIVIFQTSALPRHNCFIPRFFILRVFEFYISNLSASRVLNFYVSNVNNSRALDFSIHRPNLGNGENYIMRSLMICTPYPLLCVW
jgi:hypothetical protein